jgi:ubiquinol-cytochrome c reductase iron-sulfur subunit
MSRIVNWLLAVVVLLFGLGRRHDESRPRERIVAKPDAHPRAELVVAGLFLLAAASAALAAVAYGLGWSTQAFGGPLAAALGLLAIALIVAAKTFVPTEELDDEYPPDANPEAQGAVSQIVHESTDGITRKRLLGSAAGIAGTAIGVALVAPAVSLGPVFDTSRLNESPWRRGRALVDEEGRPLIADDIERGTFYTAFPAGADPKAIASPVILVRLDPRELRLPPGRSGWAPEGILAYSKICTHAGCAIALYRNPLFEPTEPSHALVCPCHYSTFDAGAAGKVLFGPAGRPLPMLPLAIDRHGYLRAKGNFNQQAGPSWWGVRMWKPNPHD